MAEIKSTLDLVMERTRNLNFSAEEKEVLETEKTRKAFNGLLVRYLDGWLTDETLEEEMADRWEDFREADAGTFVSAILDKVDLAALEGPLPSLLQSLFGCDVQSLFALGRQYREELALWMDARKSRMKSRMAETWQVSGSAVVPNPAADADWVKEKARLTESFDRRLAAEKEALAVRVGRQPS